MALETTITRAVSSARPQTLASHGLLAIASLLFFVFAGCNASSGESCSDLGQAANEIQGEIGLEDATPEQCERYEPALAQYHSVCFPEETPETHAARVDNALTLAACPTPDRTCVARCGADLCDDGCGGVCEGCECVPDCSGADACGMSNGCGGTCPACECVPDCSDACGLSDGCGGDCPACECVPDCDGKACGDDGCGDTCGECGDGETCADNQAMCRCVPNCETVACGLSDGCGGDCGSCVGTYEGMLTLSGTVAIFDTGGPFTCTRPVTVTYEANGPNFDMSLRMDECQFQAPESGQPVLLNALSVTRVPEDGTFSFIVETSVQLPNLSQGGTTGIFLDGAFEVNRTGRGMIRGSRTINMDRSSLTITSGALEFSR